MTGTKQRYVFVARIAALPLADVSQRSRVQAEAVWADADRPIFSNEHQARDELRNLRMALDDTPTRLAWEAEQFEAEAEEERMEIEAEERRTAVGGDEQEHVAEVGALKDAVGVGREGEHILHPEAKKEESQVTPVTDSVETAVEESEFSAIVTAAAPEYVEADTAAPNTATKDAPGLA